MTRQKFRANNCCAHPMPLSTPQKQRWTREGLRPLYSVLAVWTGLAQSPVPVRPQSEMTPLIRSQALGLLENGQTRATFTALVTTNPMHAGRQLREVRVDLATPAWKGVVNVKEAEIPVLKKHAEWLAKAAKHYPKSTDFFSSRGERDDPAPPLYFEYRGLGKDAILYLGGAGLHSLQFAGVPPSEIAAIFARAMKVLKLH